jgi:hypothetical protein
VRSRLISRSEPTGKGAGGCVFAAPRRDRGAPGLRARSSISHGERAHALWMSRWSQDGCGWIRECERSPNSSIPPSWAGKIYEFDSL